MILSQLMFSFRYCISSRDFKFYCSITIKSIEFNHFEEKLGHGGMLIESGSSYLMVVTLLVVNEPLGPNMLLEER